VEQTKKPDSASACFAPWNLEPTFFVNGAEGGEVREPGAGALNRPYSASRPPFAGQGLRASSSQQPLRCLELLLLLLLLLLLFFLPLLLLLFFRCSPAAAAALPPPPLMLLLLLLPLLLLLMLLLLLLRI
jgi:hypothetical protein